MSNDIYKVPGPVLLLSGPGTGKTYNLGLRLKYLIEGQNVSPNEITVITFASEAAKNMRTRISNHDRPELYLPYTKQPSNILTMHSLGFKILIEYSGRAGLSEPIRVIPSDLERSILLGDAAQLSGFNRSDGEEVAACRQFGDCHPSEDIKCQICTTYKKILRSCSSVDYDEQILLAVELLETFPDILAEYRKYTRHLLVDEYQDINSAQHKLIKLLSDGQTDGLFVVGDDDQSIYSWRGGSPQFIRNFKNDFKPNAKIIPLDKSYRCHRNILEGSLKIVERFDPERLQKNKFDYEVDDGPTIKIHNTPSDEKEARIIRKIVQNALPSQDVLILVPQRKFSEAISEELRNNQIGFSAQINIPGAGLPLISRLNDWLSNPSDSIALRRCIESYMGRIDSDIPSKKAKKEENIKLREGAYASISELWREVLSGKSDSLWTTIERRHEDNDLIKALWGAFNILLSLYNDNGNITDFNVNVSNFLSPWKKIPKYLEEVTSWVDMIRQFAPEGSDSNVRILTFQGAKGLEAKVVCVVGLEEGVMPRLSDEEVMPEQSRLLFVSMTRAINELHLFHARVRSSRVMLRNVFQGKGLPDIQTSRFISAIPNKYFESVYHKA